MLADQSPFPPTKAYRKPPRARRMPSERLEITLHDLVGERGRIIIHREVPWASITFAGTRHNLTLSFTGAEAVAAGENLLAILPDHEFAIPGQIVADAQVLRVDHAMLPEPAMRVEIELLLLEDA